MPKPKKNITAVSKSEGAPVKERQTTDTATVSRIDSTASILSVKLESIRLISGQKLNPIIAVRPASPSWEQLEKELADVTIIPKPLIWITIKEYFDQGYGAELLTAAEIARATHKKKNPSHLFIKMISKASGNWRFTLGRVRETWQVRRNALEVIVKLGLNPDSAKAILKLSWRLKGTILRYLGIATEKGTGVKNPAGLFLALTRKPRPGAT